MVKGEYVILSCETQRTPLRSPSLGIRNIRIVRSNSLSRVLPLKENLTSRVRQRNRTILRDGRGAVETSDIVADARFSGRNIS